MIYLDNAATTAISPKVMDVLKESMDSDFANAGTIYSIGLDAKKKVELSGGISKNSLTKNTSFLVTGNKTGSKVEKAKNMGIPILNEDEFIKLVNNG